MNGPGTELTVGAVTRHYARVAPAKCALYDGERSLAYGEVDAMVDALASALVRDGVARGDVVSAYLPNCIDYIVVVLAVARAGATFSPINPRYKAFEIAAILRQARPRVVFTTTAEKASLAKAIADAAPIRPRVVLVDAIDGDDSLRRMLARAPDALPVVAEDDCFSLMFTSGTTGEPRGALATHRARMLWVLNAAIQYGLTEDDVYLGTMPQVHSAGLTFTLMHLYAGATVRILSHFDPAAFIDIVARERITSALAVPTMLTMVVEALDQAAAPLTLASLKRLVTCGSRLPLATKKRVLEKMTPRLYDYYGSTESNSMSVLRPADQLRKPDSVGQAFRNVELMIANADGSACAPNVVGEVCCVNPSLFIGYRDRPEDTQHAFFGRWYRTGDLGFLDDEGYLHLVGRSKDVVISGGINIYPAEIERVLMLHPDVLDAAVVGVTDEKWGQAVKAYLVLRKGATMDLAEVQRHCAAHLADFKKPRSVEFREALPKNAGGKTVKSALTEAAHA
ncbi:MAG: class I adenylate-forming enzyme family protein [Betaproteobacteria bacterium]|jgi:acyl-CoA synthetase (AMP-forming)/AMP-acid ligase II